jgi:glutathione S-transferase
MVGFYHVWTVLQMRGRDFGDDDAPVRLCWPPLDFPQVVLAAFDRWKMRPMKLFYTPNSPYARRTVLAVREFDLPVELVDVSPLAAPDNILRNLEPGGKVPALQTDEGAFICETLLILNYLDGLSGARLYPGNAEMRAVVMQVEGIAALLMDSLFVRSHENRRDSSEQSPSLIEKETERAAQCYDALEDVVERFGRVMHMGSISTVAALGYAD